MKTLKRTPGLKQGGDMSTLYLSLALHEIHSIGKDIEKTGKELEKEICRNDKLPGKDHDVSK